VQLSKIGPGIRDQHKSYNTKEKSYIICNFLFLKDRRFVARTFKWAQPKSNLPAAFTGALRHYVFSCYVNMQIPSFYHMMAPLMF
jgi:hypothetical protein